MRITPLSEAARRPRRVAVGVFDGVHRGHQAVIDGSDTVLTFDPNPVAVIRPEAAPPALTSLERKAELVAGLGVAELVVIAFDKRFAGQGPQEFIDAALVGQLGAEQVSVGRNFRFGRRQAGDVALLERQDAFATRAVELVDVDGEAVSSSRVRELVAEGEVGAAARLLGRPFQVRGVVIEGDRRGRELGFPTANIRPDERLVRPGNGIYAALVDGRPAAVSVGVRPTFADADAEVLVEAYLLDFDGDLYGQELRVDFVERLRSEEAFDDVDALVDQMHRDVAKARAVLTRLDRSVAG